MFTVREDDLRGEESRALLALHLAGMNANSPPGSGPAFEAALALYRKRGFTNGGRFSDYEKSDFNQFLHLDL